MQQLKKKKEFIQICGKIKLRNKIYTNEICLRNSYRRRGMFWKQEVLDYIDEKLSQTWSPEQISDTPCGMKMPSFKTIYRWIDEKYLRSTPKNCAGKEKTVSVQATEEGSRREKYKETR